MRHLTENEILSLKDLLYMESNALIQLKAAEPIVMDRDLKGHVDSAMLAIEARIKGLHQLIHENHILDDKEMN